MTVSAVTLGSVLSPFRMDFGLYVKGLDPASAISDDEFIEAIRKYLSYHGSEDIEIHSVIVPRRDNGNPKVALSSTVPTKFNL